MAGMVSMSLGHAQNMTEPMTVQDSTALRVKRITVLAACLPGAGQMVNRQFWKVPVVWGSMGYATWAILENAREKRASVADLIALSDDDPDTQPVLTDGNGNLFSESQLNDRALFYRRNRDLSVLGLLVAHGLQILDANTGAMLRNFDTSDQLTIHGGNQWGVPVVHLKWTFPHHDRRR